MKMFFSYSRKGFFSKEISGTLPSDAVELLHDEYEWLLKRQSEGDTIVFNKDSVTTQPSITYPDVSERYWRDSELSRADIEIYKLQDGDVNSSGSVSVWRGYRKSLRAWPEQKDFPNKESRPVAPDS